jgi:hypothetical protein
LAEEGCRLSSPLLSLQAIALVLGNRRRVSRSKESLEKRRERAVLISWKLGDVSVVNFNNEETGSRAVR